ncbi:MAG: hypothetical protein ACYTGQ_10880 [Planctomycetota bacterium]
MLGRIVDEDERVVRVSANGFAPDQITEVPVANIASREVSPVSIMPPGLLTGLNKNEVLDLLAYLMSRGDPRARVYR